MLSLHLILPMIPFFFFVRFVLRRLPAKPAFPFYVKQVLFMDSLFLYLYALSGKTTVTMRLTQISNGISFKYLAAAIMLNMFFVTAYAIQPRLRIRIGRANVPPPPHQNTR
jgi:hypothetical protein